MILAWIYRVMHLGEQLKEIRQEQKILKTQFDYILACGNRGVRRKWKRMLTNVNSPFYILGKEK